MHELLYIPSVETTGDVGLLNLAKRPCCNSIAAIVEITNHRQMHTKTGGGEERHNTVA